MSPPALHCSSGEPPTRAPDDRVHERRDVKGPRRHSPRVIGIDDVDGHHRRAAAAGATIPTPPTDRPWGRDYEVRDPEGYVFGTTERSFPAGSWPPPP